VNSHPSEARRAYLVTLSACVLNIVGMSIDLTFWRTRLHQTPTWHVISITVASAMIIVIFRYRPTRKPWIASLGFVLINLIIEVAVWRGSTPLATSGLDWVPFQTEKLGTLTVAVLAPPAWWAGVLSIGIFTGGAVAHYFALPPEVSARMLAEPWATAAYGAFGLLLYGYRVQALRMERRMAESLAAKGTMEHVSRMLLAVRDFSNTPLQTLYLTTALLRYRHRNDSELLERMDRSLARLRELNEIMSRYETEVGWKDGEESLDAAAVLQRGLTATRASSRARPFSRTRER
jgi:hypothetical protein